MTVREIDAAALIVASTESSRLDAHATAVGGGSALAADAAP
jgi:hypothetical protein